MRSKIETVKTIGINSVPMKNIMMFIIHIDNLF